MIYQFPSNFVGIVKPEFPSDLYESLLIDIDALRTNQNERNGCWSDYGQQSKPWVHRPAGKYLLQRLIPDGIKDVLSNIDIGPLSVFTITDAWFGHYRQGGIHQPHTHAGSDISVIFILRSTGENKTVFFQQGNKLTERVFHAKDADAGSLIVFPSLLPHYVMAAESERTIISANLRAG